jgi:hypothetical protein
MRFMQLDQGVVVRKEMGPRCPQDCPFAYWQSAGHEWPSMCQMPVRMRRLQSLRRPYQAPQTPLRRLAASRAADAVKLAELQQRGRLDPFQVSASIEADIFSRQHETVLLYGLLQQTSQILLKNLWIGVGAAVCPPLHNCSFVK